MSNDHWILNDEGQPVKATLDEWAVWFETSKNRIVRQEVVNGIKVSTVFLGIDHNFAHQGAPLLWETMVFGGKLDQEMLRCSGNREQAEAMHEEMLLKMMRAEGMIK